MRAENRTHFSSSRISLSRCVISPFPVAIDSAPELRYSHSRFRFDGVTKFIGRSRNEAAPYPLTRSADAGEFRFRFQPDALDLPDDGRIRAAELCHPGTLRGGKLVDPHHLDLRDRLHAGVHPFLHRHA
jgi:hypothetical protein